LYKAINTFTQRAKARDREQKCTSDITLWLLITNVHGLSKHPVLSFIQN